MVHGAAGDEGTAGFDARAPAYRAAFARFLRAAYASELRQLRASLATGGAASSGPVSAPSAPVTTDAQQQSFAYSLRADAQRLLDFSPSLGSLLFRHPDQLLPLFHAALADVIESEEDVKYGRVPLRARQKLKVRVEHLPPVSSFRKATISAIRSNDVRQLIQVAGTVVRTGMVRVTQWCCKTLETDG